MVERRAVLVAGGAVVAGGLLAACGVVEGAEHESGERETGEHEGGEHEGGGSAGQAAPAGALALTSEVPVEGGVVNDQVGVVVTQPVAGDYKAFSAVCTHQGCLVGEVVANEIICPCHGARYSAVDGSVISGPAIEGLAAAKVAVEGDAIKLV